MTCRTAINQVAPSAIDRIARETTAAIIKRALIHCPLRPISFEDVDIEAVVAEGLRRVVAENR